MTDAQDLSEGFDPAVAEAAKRAAEERQAAERHAALQCSRHIQVLIRQGLRSWAGRVEDVRPCIRA